MEHDRLQTMVRRRPKKDEERQVTSATSITEDGTLHEPPVRGVRQIGIHGPRNAGKTCYLACLYGARAGEKLHVTFSDSDGLAYLAGVWKDLEQQQVPEATRGIPTDIRLDLEDTERKRTWALGLRDYPGALVQPVSNSATPLERQLSETVKKWIAESHALLVFLDSGDPSVEQVDAVDLLLTELRRESSNGYTLERPVGIVLTKWDRVNPGYGEPKDEEERAQAFLQEHPVFSQVYRKFCDAGERIRVFPVSAFGNQSRDNKPPPLEDLHPYNLHAPLLWAAQKAEEVLFDNAQAEANRRLAPRRFLPRGPFRSLRACKRAIGVFEALKREYLIHDGPIAGRIDQAVAALRSKRRRTVTALVVAPLMVVGAVGAILANYGHQRDERALLQLVHVIQENPGRENAQKRVTAEKAYLRSWTSRLHPTYRREVESWLATDGQVAQAVEAFQSTQERGRALLLENKIADAIAGYRDFVAHNEGTPEAVDAEARVLDLSPLLEDFTEYEAIRVAAGPGHAAALEAAYHKASLYERSRRAKKPMADHVRTYRQWFESLKKETSCYIEVTSVSIPKDSDLSAFWGTKPRVVIEMNGQRHATDWFRGNNPSIQARLGPFPCRWGEPGTLRVRVEGHHAVLKNDHAEKTVEDESFILRRAQGPFAIQCVKGKTITVQLRCPQAEAPDLPTYMIR